MDSNKMISRSCQTNLIKRREYNDNYFIRYNKEHLTKLENVINGEQTNESKMEKIRKWVNQTEPNLDYKEGFVDDKEEDIQNSNEVEVEDNNRINIMDELIIEECKVNYLMRDTRQVKSKKYTMWEQREILKYIFKNNYEEQVMGNKIWKRMEQEQIIKDRPWQSLRNHFRRTILKEPLFSVLVKSKGQELLNKK